MAAHNPEYACGSRYRAAGDWLIFADQQGVGLRLSKLVEERGGHCILIHPGQAFPHENGKQFTINPTEPSDIRRIMTGIRENKPYRRIVYLWGSERRR